jgi:hypothetical protein
MVPAIFPGGDGFFIARNDRQPRGAPALTNRLRIVFFRQAQITDNPGYGSVR